MLGFAVIHVFSSVEVLAEESPEAEQIAAEPVDEKPIEEIVVKGQLPGPPGSFIAAPTRATPNEPDATQILKLVPGGDVVSNGPITGQVQYRGMFGDRINVLIDDAFISPGGPNWMDAPLHYATRPILDHIEMDLGIASVSSGSESIGGTTRAVLKSSEFADADELDVGGELEVGGRTADKSFAGGGIVSAASENHRFHVLGSAELGQDYRVGGGGRVEPSEYQRYQYGGGYGMKAGDHQVGLDYRYNDTKESGTPALPMDIMKVGTHMAKADYEAELGPVKLDVLGSFNDVDHIMDNFTLRPPPAAGPTRWRQNHATSQGGGWSLSGAVDWLSGQVEVGVDGHVAQHDAHVTNPNAPAFFVDVFKDARKDRYGTWAEWAGDVSERWDLELGVRYTRVSMDSDEVDGTPAQTAPPATALRDAFNAADRSQNDNLVDAVAKVGFTPRSDLRLEVAGGRKTRSASYVERFGWLPTQAAGGLADGHNYVGGLGLAPEVSYEFAAEAEWMAKQGIYLAPRVFYRRVFDYIQGTPSTDPNVIAVSTANGDPNPLEFSNVEAELYGVDLAYGVNLPFDLLFDGTLSYVRGRRVDITDDLYRISPLHGRTTLTYQRDLWSFAVEGVYAAAQDKVSATNGEQTSDAWGALNIYGTWDPMDELGFVAGVNNVTDNHYNEHLAGISRVTGSGVTAGSGVPSPGVSFFIRAIGRF